MKLLTRSEEYILLAVWKLQDNAYSIPIQEKLNEITGKEWSLGGIYMPLERLEKRGQLMSVLSESTPERGGRHKRIYKLTPAGKKALREIYEVQQTIWAGIPQLMFGLS
ncbi:MAG: helix-turn-helix transcriptional regulator [Balneolaceae bacterium]